jgi:4-hydroxy-3-polyprenylbenzoate decarboxylase
MIPPVPSFYNHPKNLEEMIDHIVARVLDQFELETPNAARWHGLHESEPLGERLITA